MGLSFLTISLEKFKKHIGRKKLVLDKIVSYNKIFDFGGSACVTLIKI